MRAAWYERNGPAREVLTVGEMPDPEPGPGEVRVRLATSGVNPSDVKARAGRTRKIAFPRVIPHSDGAGTIDAVGPGVPASRLGERVWTWNAQWKRAFGTCAEAVTLPGEMAVPLPDSASFEIGACLGIPLMTAAHVIETAQAWAGSTLLISGGAGAVSHYAIQLARMRGAVVITTVSSPEKAALARAAGADHVIDYRREDVGARVKELTDGAGVDAVIELDIAANTALLPQVLRPRGLVVVYGTGGAEGPVPLYFFLTGQIALKFVFVYELTAEERATALATIAGALAAGRLVHNIAAVMPLAEVAAAHEAVESGRVAGNVVLSIG
ncbi:NADPH:quinone reductase [Rhodoplanes sp. TEM]|uniref:NADPH:quinone reductase n=1 Tax=Rhodoplanes tepidamans TaxID=200616 RepID=A0ABT5JEC0_RHOTP|nr:MULTISPECIES: NADPH:quinone reductase [Rhodoplanes]MDC7787788.1 NADPH:quinone reductase [Rhodoplanes tepidamans]MDC7982649.1 NADPH:quinone reductase [Rhodoplanes sp. TEM]MDQ0357704.1 NADPH2:quinone reductase [Rhodoplanes tepidamans]